MKTVKVTLSSQEMKIIESCARGKKVSPEELFRESVIEKLNLPKRN